MDTVYPEKTKIARNILFLQYDHKTKGHTFLKGGGCLVKGVSKQVIVVHSPDKKLFDQAIFILSDDAVQNRAVTNDALLREAKRLLRSPVEQRKHSPWLQRFSYAVIGAILTGGIWALSVIL